MDNLKALMDGEYSDYSAFSGINTDGTAELLGAIARLPKEKQGKAIKMLLRKKHHNERTSRSEMESKLDQLPKEILDGLINKRLQLADTSLFVTKEVSAKSSIDMLIGTDPKATGVGSLAQQKLDKDYWFLLFGMILRYGTSTTGVGAVDFTHIPAIIRNGDFELQAGNKQLIGIENCTVFDTRDRHDIPIGFWGWDNCKIIEPQVEIKLPIKFTGSAEANSFLRLEFVGTAVVPY